MIAHLFSDFFVGRSEKNDLFIFFILIPTSKWWLRIYKILQTVIDMKKQLKKIDHNPNSVENQYWLPFFELVSYWMVFIMFWFLYFLFLIPSYFRWCISFDDDNEEWIVSSHFNIKSCHKNRQNHQKLLFSLCVKVFIIYIYSSFLWWQQLFLRYVANWKFDKKKKGFCKRIYCDCNESVKNDFNNI